MLTFDEARKKLLEAVATLPAERVPLDAADGRVIAEDVVAPNDLPRFDYSAMDGYAVRTTDLEGDGPFELAVSGEIAAGGATDVPLAPHSAARIFTGAPLAQGSDAVLMQENVERSGDTIRFKSKPSFGENVRRRGEDLRRGAVAITRGTRLAPGHVALAAALDRPTLLVARRPIVTVIGSGDELRSPGEPDRPGSVPESNGYFVAAQARRAGAVVRMAHFLRDDLETAKTEIRALLGGADVVVTIGGVSVGDHDVIRPALEAAGVAIDFYKVAMKPGKPLTVGRRDNVTVLGLPGNPASASLTFLLFGVPLLRALQGDPRAIRASTPMKIRGTLRRKPGRREFARARIVREGAEIAAELLPNQASGAVTSFAAADALVVVPEERGDVADGETLEVLSIDC